MFAFSIYQGRKALGSLSNGRFNPDQLPDIIILDHYKNKPGEWLFLDSLTEILPHYNQFISVHIISAFLYQVEQSRLMAYEFINSFNIKPLTKELLIAINNAHDTAKATSIVYPVKN